MRFIFYFLFFLFYFPSSFLLDIDQNGIYRWDVPHNMSTAGRAFHSGEKAEIPEVLPIWLASWFANQGIVLGDVSLGG